MRKNILSLSIATMIGSIGVAHAATIVPTTPGVFPATLAPANGTAAASTLSLAAGGIGHALLTPYYTAQSGNATVISIVNTDTANGKAVKVRFRGQANSDDVLDFAVYMSPNDHWSAVVTKNATTGIAQLTTNDNTCTVPPLVKGVAQSFITARLPSYATAADLGNHTSEGYIEIFNMADVPSATATTSLFQSILHASGTPRNCAADAVQATPLVDATSEADAISKGFMAPTTGLFGNWTIINVPATTTFSGSMTAIRALTVAGLDGYGNYVVSPQSGTSATNVSAQTADPLFRASTTTVSATGVPGATAVAAQTAAFFDLPDMSTPYTPFGLAAGVLVSPGTGNTGNDLLPLGQAWNLTNALAITSVSNEYSTDPTLTATTDWNFSFPTRRYSVNYKYGTAATAGTRIFSSVATATGTNPGVQFFHSAGSGVGNITASGGDRLCVTATGQAFYDREEGSRTSGAVFSPGNVSAFTFCGETSVTSFGSGASVLGASNGSAITNAFVSGWGRINIGGAGLPMMGNSFIKLNNPAVSAGVSGTYGITSDHRFFK